MSRLLVSLCIVSALVLTACAGSHARVAQSNGLTIGVAFAPDPPKQGPTSITVTVKDAQGKPVPDAAVQIEQTMPTMSMTGPTLTAKDDGDGTYSSLTNLNYATQWHFGVSVKALGTTGNATFVEDVK
ncbi:MAG TPA: FixH family protein [Candidatus Baltobacteraceae bacterium]|nr:FixH family protein [Candidatus Baltobacteraceae bacterium]